MKCHKHEQLGKAEDENKNVLSNFTPLVYKHNLFCQYCKFFVVFVVVFAVFVVRADKGFSYGIYSFVPHFMLFHKGDSRSTLVALSPAGQQESC